MTVAREATIIALLAISALTTLSSTAQEPKVSQPAAATVVNSAPAGVVTETVAATGTRRALIVCGLSGDAAHHKLFAETVTKLQAGLVAQLGFAAEHVQMLFGDEPQDADADEIKSAGRATREELEKRVAALRETLRPEDGLWVIVLGHSHYDSRHSWLNLPGPDIHQTDFAKLFNGLTAAEQVFVLTAPTSGFYVKPLAAKGRIVITATEADWETNETEYPQQLVTFLTTPPPLKELDVDEDGSITLFDLYVNVARNLAQSYVERTLLATEHPLLDDNGDGRGTEVQIDYLTEDQGGRSRAVKKLQITPKPNADGQLSKLIKLPIKAGSAPPPDSAPAKESETSPGTE